MVFFLGLQPSPSGPWKPPKSKEVVISKVVEPPLEAQVKEWLRVFASVPSSMFSDDLSLPKMNQLGAKGLTPILLREIIQGVCQEDEELRQYFQRKENPGNPLDGLTFRECQMCLRRYLELLKF